ncbi:MAG: DUF4129 domain-containing protein [Chloroflexi bacterium]|nr:DUF4129 domain-containing protein [Chloroflexota bacterium]
MAEAPVEQSLMPQDSLWLRGILRPLMVALLATCLAIGFIAVAQAAIPGWGRGAVLPFLSLVALEAVYTTLWLAASERRDRRTFRFRFGEICLLLIAARLLTFYVKGQWPTATLLSQWLRSPLSFFDGTSFFLGILTLIVWGQSTAMMGALERMSLKPDELVVRPLSARDLDWNEIRARHPSRSMLLREFSTYWLWGGVLLALCAGLSRVELKPAVGQLIGIRHLGITPMLQGALVIYFLGGLLLISQGRLAVLRARWRYEGTDTDPELVRRWGRLGIGMLALVGLLAALLPFGSSFTMARILAAVINFMMQISYAALLLFFALFAWLLGLLGLGSEQAPAAEALRPPPEPPDIATSSLHLPDWLGGALVWLLMAVIIGYSVVAYLGGRGIRLDSRWLRRLWHWWRAWWQTWRGRTRRLGQRVRSMIALTLASVGGGGVPRWRFLSLRKLGPRERVRYFYLSTVRRASERGVPRQPSETPHEYEVDLTAHWPEIEQDLTSLTEAFVDARYSAHPLQPEDARRVQEIWRRVKAALRQRDREEGQDSKLT